MIDDATVTKLLAGRKAVEDHKQRRAAAARLESSTSDAQHTASTQQLLSELQALGFASFDEFFEFNEQVCLALVQLTNRFAKGSCDRCQGYAGTPPCQAAWGSLSCAVTGKKPTNDQELAWSRLQAYRTMAFNPVVSGNRIYTFCPPGHGYYFDKADLADQRLIAWKFNLKWQP